MKEEKQRNLLIINSSKKATGTDTNFTYELGDTSLNIDALSVKSVFIPHTFTNINNGNNIVKASTGSEITVIYGSGRYLINDIVTYVNITPGAYTLQNLIELVNYQAGSIFNTSYNESTNRVDFTLQSNFSESGIPLFGDDTNSFWQYLGVNAKLLIPNPKGTTVSSQVAPPSPNVVNSDLVIPVGQYTSPQLVSAVVLMLSTVVSGSLSTATVNNNRVQIGGATQTWKFLDCFITRALGFTGNEDYSLLQTAPNIQTLYGTRNLYIKSNLLCNGYNSIEANGKKSSILINIPVNSVFGGSTSYEANYPIIKHYSVPVNISSIDIEIVDDEGIVIETEGADVIIICETYSSRKL